MTEEEIKQNQNKVTLAGGIILFVGTIYLLLFLAMLLSRQEEYITLIPSLLLGSIYTPLGYFALYKKNRWAIFSSLILIFLSCISTLFSNGGGAIILVLILIPVYQGAEAAFKLHTKSS